MLSNFILLQQAQAADGQGLSSMIMIVALIASSISS